MDILDELRDLIGADQVSTAPERLEAYRYDLSRDPAAQTPLAVVRPVTAEQVQQTMKWAAAQRIPVIPRGAGTSLSGGASAQQGSIVLALDRMTGIAIDPDTRTAVVEPGALNIAVKQAAAEHGLWYPPDPSSVEISSIGGNVATNAGGLCCVKYGVTRDYVLGLDVVLADGRLARLGGPRLKDVAGLSLLQLFVGSEGTLGVVTRIVLRLVPELPPPATLVALFATPDEAAAAVVETCSAVRPSMVELMDNASINAVEDFQSMGLDRAAGALLLIQTDAPGAARELELEVAQRACEKHGATAVFSTDDPEEAQMFVAARRAIFPALDRLGPLMLEDVGVPLPALPALVRGIGAIAQRHRLRIPVVAHAGDGNTHPIIVLDPADPDCRDRAALAYDEIMRLALSLDGTITGEHGIGRIKRPWLAEQLGPDVMDLHARIKNALDPDGLLNPGAGY
ncbi:FAD-binding oxidoreductase [Metallococcus carri]|uniref:FAD-binding oxidoreductase n=1 Tax=Metallococcus carri TaxID=1656884 RepID=UPI002E2B6902|nr:FAD-linked oxidase C-terminal domain-containing protein [Metallococcus carri]